MTFADDHQLFTETEGKYRDMALTHILLVEDNPGDTYLIQRMIEPSDVSSMAIHPVTRLRDAINYVSQHEIDAILLDLSLPDSQGISTLTTLLEHAPTIPIIVLTGLNDDELGVQAVQARAQDYLVKGTVDQALLIRSIRYAIERKRLEQNLQQSKQELEVLYEKVSTLEQLKTDMIRIASHDIGGLLGIMIGHLYLLMDEDADPLTDFQRHSVKEINDAAQRMTALSRDILSLERIESHEEHLTQTVSLDALVKAIYTQTQSQAARKHQQLELSIADEPLTVTGDSVQLQEAIVNMLSNAIKYTPDNGQIEMRVYTQDDAAVLEIQDNGYGIPEELQENLFQPFYRAKTKATADIPGTGLGLHLVKNIIERHQGQMIFQSVYGEGSLFGFRLPLA
jgi:signal transduction histidine kinase